MTLPVRPWQQVGNSSGFTRITSRDFEFDNDPNVELSVLGIMGNLSKCWQPAMNMGFSVPEVPTCFSTSVQPTSALPQKYENRFNSTSWD